MPPPSPPPARQARILVTGANGHIGRLLLRRVAGESGLEARAFVRSERARATLDALPEAARPEVVVADYADGAALEAAARGCDAVVHLVGIIKESSTTRYADAHEGTCTTVALAAAKAGVDRIVYPSIFGADPDARNPALASRGRAEDILLRSDVGATVLRLPMVLGPGDAAARALGGQACAPVVPLVRGGRTLEQPIYAEDVVRAVLAAMRAELADSVLELGGPESLTHRALVRRAAALFGRTPRIVPVPLWLARAGAALAARVSSDPPVTPAMLGVLEHDDRVDPGPACARLGLSLTPLDETLRRTVGPDADEEGP